MNFKIFFTKTYAKHLKLLFKKSPLIKNNHASCIESFRKNTSPGQLVCRGRYKTKLTITFKNPGMSICTGIMNRIKPEEKNTLQDILNNFVMGNITGKQLIFSLQKANLDV